MEIDPSLDFGAMAKEAWDSQITGEVRRAFNLGLLAKARLLKDQEFQERLDRFGEISPCELMEALGLATKESLYLVGRNMYIYELRTTHGKSANEIAQAFGITRQMVHMILKKQLENLRGISKFL